MPASSDPIDRARRLAARMDTHRAALARLADERAQAIRDALAGGMSQAEVAKALGITRQAVNQALMRPSPVLR